LKKDQALYILDWLKRKCRLGWKPGVIKSHIVGNETHNLPVLNRSDKPWNLWEQFAEEHPTSPSQMQSHKNAPILNQSVPPSSNTELDDVEKVWKPGRGTFLELLKYVTSESHSKSCLSYYYVRLIETFDLYKRLVTEMERARTHALKHYDELNPGEEQKAAIRRGMQPVTTCVRRQTCTQL
jgi:hypothetical protein